MMGSILLVCAANICRSPLMEYTLRGALHDPEQWEITSAGVSARDGAPCCELAQSVIRPDEMRALAYSHRSAPLSDAMLDADIVIVASRAERSLIAQRSPQARDRVFTLTEAVLLGRGAAPLLASGEAQASTAEEYARLLDAQRGMLIIPRPKQQRRYRSTKRAPHALDIPDDHHRRRHAHLGTLKRVRAEALELSSQLPDAARGA